VRGIGDVGQRDERDTDEELGRERSAELDDDPCLSDTAGTRDRDDAMFPNKLDERCEIGGTADERRGRLGQVARQAGEPLALAPLAPLDPVQRCRRPIPRTARTGARRS
jgi:hypothetical protein